jgi:hypothetical protein
MEVICDIYIYMYICIYNFIFNNTVVDRDNTIDIATGYELDGPEIEFRWRQDFSHPSRQALVPTQPHVRCLSGLYRG